jgi:histidinol-phosphatase (PHP family)
MYPAPVFLQMCVDAGAPVALSSDAHRPEDVGAGYEHALALLEGLGVGELCIFERRERRLAAIGPSDPAARGDSSRAGAP